jgi:hypothetical protein
LKDPHFPPRITSIRIAGCSTYSAPGIAGPSLTPKVRAKPPPMGPAERGVTDVETWHGGQCTAAPSDMPTNGGAIAGLGLMLPWGSSNPSVGTWACWTAGISFAETPTAPVSTAQYEFSRKGQGILNTNMRYGLKWSYRTRFESAFRDPCRCSHSARMMSAGSTDTVPRGRSGPGCLLKGGFLVPASRDRGDGSAQRKPCTGCSGTVPVPAQPARM